MKFIFEFENKKSSQTGNNFGQQTMEKNEKIYF